MTFPQDEPNTRSWPDPVMPASLQCRLLKPVRIHGLFRSCWFAPYYRIFSLQIKIFNVILHRMGIQVKACRQNYRLATICLIKGAMMMSRKINAFPRVTKVRVSLQSRCAAAIPYIKRPTFASCTHEGSNLLFLMHFVN